MVKADVYHRWLARLRRSSGPSGRTAEDDRLAGRARPDAFISYRRLPADTAFVDQLQVALAEGGKQVWVDRSDIEPAAYWSERIARGIQAAKALIFVVSPESVASEQCLAELDQADRLHKLIIPVVFRDVGRRDLPDSLSRPNWIFFTSGHSAERAVGWVIQALEDDLPWRDNHARLAVRTTEWANSRDRNRLLRGSDLRAAEQWLDEARSHPKTPPTALQTEYIRASRKAARRRRILTGSTAATALVIALVSTLLAYQQNRAANSADRNVTARKLVATAQSLLGSQPRTSLLLSVEAVKLDPIDPYVRANLISGLTQTQYDGVLAGHANPFTALAFSPDGHLLADASAGGTVILWDVSRVHHWKKLAVLKSQSSGMISMAFSPDGRTLAALGDSQTGNQNGTLPASVVTIWDIAGPTHPIRLAAITNPSGGDLALAFSPDGRALATDAGNGITIFDITNPSHPAPIGHLVTHQIVGPEHLAFSPDGHTLIASVDFSGDSGNVMIWDVTNLARPSLLSTIHINHGHDDGLATALSPDGSILATASTGGAATLWDIRNRIAPKQIAVLPSAGQGNVIELAFSPDGHNLAAAYTDHTVNLWSLQNPVHPELAANLAGHTGTVYALAFSSSEHLLATGSSDATTILWNVTAPAHPAMLPATISINPGQTLTALAFDRRPKGSLLATAGNGQRLTDNGEVILWGTSAGGHAAVLGTLTGSDHQVLGISLSPDGRTAVTAYQDGTVVAWDIADPMHPRREAVLTSRGNQLSAAGPQVAFSPDGRTIASTTSTGWALWNNANHHLIELADIRGNGSATAIAFSPDGNTVAVSANAGVALWTISDRDHPRLLSELPDRAGILMAVAFSPDGHMLVTIPPPFAGIPPNWSTVSPKLWDVTDRARPALLSTLPTHTGIVALNAAFTPDGHLLATANDDGTKILWDISDGQHPVELTTLPGYSQSAAIAIAPDGQTLAAGNTKDSASLWSIGELVNIAANPINEACSIAGPGLDAKDWAHYIPNIAYQPICP